MNILIQNFEFISIEMLTLLKNCYTASSCFKLLKYGYLNNGKFASYFSLFCHRKNLQVKRNFHSLSSVFSSLQNSKMNDKLDFRNEYQQYQVSIFLKFLFLFFDFEIKYLYFKGMC